MNDLVQHNPHRGAMIASTACSPGLWQRSTDRGLSFADAVKEIASDPGLVPELAQAKHRLELAATPARRDQIAAILAPMARMYGLKDRSEAEWKTFWEFYVRALGDLPLECIEAGVADYVERSDSEFFPKPGPLKELCRKRAEPLLMALGRVRAAARLVKA